MPTISPSITYPLPDSELIHFYATSGARASVIVYEFRLDESIEKERLKHALDQALPLFPNFAVQLLIGPRGLLFAPNPGTPLILEDDGRPVRFGEDDTHHFLFVLSYRDNLLRFRVHHSLSDGRGILAFAQCVLGHYFGLPSLQVDPQPLKKDDPVFKPYIEAHVNPSARARGAFTVTADTPVFPRPEPRFPADCAKGRVFEITCPISTILKTTKRDDTTPVPFLAVLIANAYRNLYPVGDKTLVLGCAVDYRRVFPDGCRNNASGSVALPYFSKIAQSDLPTQRTIMRARLDLETQAENLVASLTTFSRATESFKQIPLPIPQAAQLVSAQISQSTTAWAGMISYVGGLRWNPELDSHIRSIAVFYSPFAIAPYFMGIEEKGIWHLTCTQVDDSERLIKEVYRLFQEETKDVILIDRGTWDFDGLYLENIPSIS